MDCRGREELAEYSGFEYTEENLDETGNNADAQRQPIRLDIRRGIHAARKPELGHAPERHDDEAGSRPLDRHLGVTDEGGQDTSNDGSKNARDCRVAARKRDGETQRKRDEEHQKAGQRVGSPVSP